MKNALAAAAVLVLVLSPGCRGREPERVQVQHILVAFQGSIPEAKVTRTKEEAGKLAQDLLARARKGDDFDALVREYTDDQHPGIYGMTNFNVAPDPNRQEYARERMVRAFGDVSFGLKIGAVGLAAYDPETSKYGWHIIKRLR